MNCLCGPGKEVTLSSEMDSTCFVGVMDLYASVLCCSKRLNVC